MERHERFIKAINFLKEKGVVRFQSDVADAMGFDKGSISRAIKGDQRYLTDKMLTKFNTTYNNIFSLQWLKVGIGEMLNDGTEEAAVEQLIIGSPYYNIGFSEIKSLTPDTHWEYKVNFRPFNASTMWCDVNGNSMAPVLCHGDIVSLRKISDFSYITYGEVYGVVMKNGLSAIRMITKTREPNQMRLVPYNKKDGFEEQVINIDEIDSLYIVTGFARSL